MSLSAGAQETLTAKQRRQKSGMICLLIGIPLTSVLLGVLTLYLAFTTTDREVQKYDLAPLSKTSWQESVDDR